MGPTAEEARRQAAAGRGMWVWNTAAILANTTEQDFLITKVKAAGVTDLYLYLTTGRWVGAWGRGGLGWRWQEAEPSMRTATAGATLGSAVAVRAV